jgi:hypothetical protein
MYAWKIEIILNSGKELTAYDKNDFNNSTDVANKVMAGVNNEIVGLGNKEGTANILVKKSEIAAITISAA